MNLLGIMAAKLFVRSFNLNGSITRRLIFPNFNSKAPNDHYGTNLV